MGGKGAEEEERRCEQRKREEGKTEKVRESRSINLHLATAMDVTPLLSISFEDATESSLGLRTCTAECRRVLPDLAPARMNGGRGRN